MQERFTVAGVLRAHADERPAATMLVAGDERRSWADQHARAAQVAQAMLADGVGVGDRVAILDRNGLGYFDTLFGGALLGAVNVAVNWRLAPSEMAAIIDDAWRQPVGRACRLPRSPPRHGERSAVCSSSDRARRSGE